MKSLSNFLFDSLTRRSLLPIPLGLATKSPVDDFEQHHPSKRSTRSNQSSHSQLFDATKGLIQLSIMHFIFHLNSLNLLLQFSFQFVYLLPKFSVITDYHCPHFIQFFYYAAVTLCRHCLTC